MTDYQKGERKIAAIIATAERSIAKRGQRENYPYDQDHKLLDYLHSLSLSYNEIGRLMQEFYRRCDGLTPSGFGFFAGRR